MLRARQKRHGQRADARAHLEHVVFFTHLGKLANVRDNGIVHQKVLSERMFRGQTVTRKHVARRSNRCQMRCDCHRVSFSLSPLLLIGTFAPHGSPSHALPRAFKLSRSGAFHKSCPWATNQTFLSAIPLLADPSQCGRPLLQRANLRPRMTSARNFPERQTHRDRRPNRSRTT